MKRNISMAVSMLSLVCLVLALIYGFSSLSHPLINSSILAIAGFVGLCGSVPFWGAKLGEE